MENCVINFLQKRGYTVNDKAQSIIQMCDNWYANRAIEQFHKRKTVQGEPYELNRLNIAKRCCSDDANLCEVVEINSSKNDEQLNFVNKVLLDSNFDTNYRAQLEKTSGKGTVACYIRLDDVQFLSNNKTKGGKIKLNYVDADGFIPLTVDNGIILEAGFSGNSLEKGKKRTTLVLFVLGENKLYTSETHVFDEHGKEITENTTAVQLGNVKPFAVMRNAEVNNIDDMDGYGLPKILNSIPYFEGMDLTYNILHGDLDKGEKLLLVNEFLCKFDSNGNEITPSDQAKKTFVMLGEKLPDKDSLIHEYNPEIRIEQITKSFELILSMLSMQFGYGTKKYTFENGQITTATEYIGQKQDQMQELNRQRYEAIQYITGIVKAILWFSNTFLSTSYNLEEEVQIDFDDSYITDKEAELDRLRNDALSFDIPELTIWYLKDAYNLSDDEAEELVKAKEESDTNPSNEEDVD